MFHLEPRYTCGSPATVESATLAEQVAREEIMAYVRNTTWGRDFVPEETAKADTLGLAGIVFSVTSQARAWHVFDLITGWTGQLLYPKGVPSMSLAEWVRRSQVHARKDDVAPEWAAVVTRAHR
jgi:hypothetical protein